MSGNRSLTTRGDLDGWDVVNLFCGATQCAGDAPITAGPGPDCDRQRRGPVLLCRAMAKSASPLSKTQFIEKAEPVKLSINGVELVADKREFSTGSFGWYYNGKVTVMVDGKPLSVQAGINLTVVGSKEAER